MARVLILSLVFPPDGVSTAQLMGELAEDLAASGHEVAVITTQPHYNRDTAAELEQPLRPRWGGLLLESRFRGLQVLHTRMPESRTRWHRIRGWLGFHLLGFLAGLLSLGRADVILVPSPLLTAGLVAWAITRLRGGSYIYNVQELYPDLAVYLGRVRSPVLLRGLRWLERFVYSRACAVTAITPGICRRVRERTPAPETVHLIPNFVDLDELVPAQKANPFAKERGLVRTFNVVYAGNIGYAQGLETVLEAAERCDYDRVRFVLVGHGVLRAHLAAEVERRELRNVLLVEHQPYVRMPEVYGASDVCLVPLISGADGTALPSKVFRIMACARPVLALCDQDSELAALVRDAGAGVVVPPDRPQCLVEAIVELARCDRRGRQMGEAGRAYVERHVSRRVVTARYSDLVSAVAAGRRSGDFAGERQPARRERGRR